MDSPSDSQVIGIFAAIFPYAVVTAERLHATLIAQPAEATRQDPGAGILYGPAGSGPWARRRAVGQHIGIGPFDAVGDVAVDHPVVSLV